MNRIIKFRVYPESRHGFYFDVRIYPSLVAMQKGAANYRGLKRANFDDAAAVMRGHQKGKQNLETGRIAWTKILGTFFFHKGQIGTEIITHECTHAALRWAEVVKVHPQDINADKREGFATASEERFCYALGTMARQIADKCWELDLYK